MNTASYLNNINYSDSKPHVEVLLESDFSKEIRISFKAGQVMAEHKAPRPIVVQTISGSIAFEVNQQTHQLNQGEMISLEANIPHSLKAKTDSIIRLSLSKHM